VFGSYSSGAKVKLDEICKIVGLPGKPSGMDGGEVEAMVRAGRISQVAQYCEADVVNTYRLWLVYDLFRGALTAEQLAFSEAEAAEFIRTRKADNPHLSATVTYTGRRSLVLCLRSMSIAEATLMLAGDSRQRSSFGGQKAASTLLARSGDPGTFAKNLDQPLAFRQVQSDTKLCPGKGVLQFLHRLGNAGTDIEPHSLDNDSDSRFGRSRVTFVSPQAQPCKHFIVHVEVQHRIPHPCTS
jgi:hypothetical protein